MYFAGLMLLLAQVVVFALGCVWMFHLWPKLPQLLREMHGKDPKSPQWPAMAVLAFSLVLFLWMVGFLISTCVGPFLD